MVESFVATPEKLRAWNSTTPISGSIASSPSVSSAVPAPLAAFRGKTMRLSGARTIECIRILGRSQKPTAGVGDVIVASVKEANPSGNVKK